MSLTQNLKDDCEKLGNTIVLSHEAFEEESNITTNNSTDNQRLFLRVGKPGKLFLEPHYTAFTKTNLGSIPSKIEKTLIKTEESIPITITLNKNIRKNNDTSIDEQANKDYRSSSTSFSSKGYGVGFVSQVPRFQNDRIILPGPGQYSPDKILSVENDVNKSNFGKSLFLDNNTKSLNLLNNDNHFFTSQEILRRLKNQQYNNRYLNNLTYDSFSNNNNASNISNNDEKKGNYFFDSKVKKFSGGMFDTGSKNPGPGRYFVNTDFKIKNKNRKSPDFMEPTKKKESPEKNFGLLNNNEKKIGFNLIDNKKNGKISTFWNGAPSLGISYDFGKTIKNGKKMKGTENNYEYIFSNNMVKMPDNATSMKLKKLATLRFRTKDNFNIKDKKDGSLTKSRYDFSFDKNKNENNDLIIKDLLKFRRKDFFGLAPPRWDEGLFHDNGSHFQIPGPAYYDPKYQSPKRSFNFNTKDFIFTNSVPFKEVKKYEPYSSVTK
jgi:hypothetical protein